VSQTIRYLFSFQPTGLPSLPWTRWLQALVVFAMLGQFTDAGLTYILLTSNDRWVIEANPLMAYIIGTYGFIGMLIAKAINCVFIWCFVDSLRRRGFRVATYALAIASVLFGALLTANGLEILLY